MKIGRYEIRGEIGRGRMGVVYEAYDPLIARTVAIKTIRIDDAEIDDQAALRARFRREAQAAGRLAHSNIVSIFDVGTEGDIDFIVMEFISGGDLAERLAAKVVYEIRDVYRMLRQVLAALGHAHSNGVVHRDLKPGNILIYDAESIKVGDFGIAKIEALDLTELTADDALIGTPAYMSPEQCLRQRADHRSDLFSAGSILYQLLTGYRPFLGPSNIAMRKIISTHPQRPSERNQLLSPAWDTLISRALEKNPKARYQSAKEFSDALISTFRTQLDYSHIGEPSVVEVGSDSTIPLPVRNEQESRPKFRPKVAGGIAAVLVVGMSIAYSMLSIGQNSTRTSAQEPALSPPAVSIPAPGPGWIGVELREMTPETIKAARLKTNRGVLISGVFRGGPADEAGLRPGDVVTELHGSVVDHPRTMLDVIASMSPGRPYKYRITRGSKELTGSLTAGTARLSETK